MDPESDAAHYSASLVSVQKEEPLGVSGADRARARNAVPPLSVAELERVRNREPEALAALFDRHFDLVFGLAMRLMGDRTLAEDVAQDVFLKVHRAANRIDPSRDPAPWFTAITYNACRDVWRSGAWRMSRRSRPVDEDPGFGVPLTRGTNDPEDDALASERARLVQDAIRRLPEALRTPVVLHDYQGLGHPEIAKLLGVNPAAARKRYSRALTALATILEKTLGEAGR